jgi:hypothetical protein
MNHHNSTCKYCGRGAMSWRQINGKWRMLDINDQVHVCEAMRLAKI